MPRATLDLQNAADLSAVGGQWKCANGFVPGQPNEGVESEAEGSPCRLPDYDDSGWEACEDLGGLAPARACPFIWYRIKADVAGNRGRPVHRRGAVPVRVVHRRLRRDLDQRGVRPGASHGAGVQCAPSAWSCPAEPQAGDEVTIAILAMNGPLAAPGGSRVRALRHVGLRVAGNRATEARTPIRGKT